MANLSGFGQGFTQGRQAATEAATAQAKIQALQQEQMDNKLEYYSNVAQSQLKNIETMLSNAPQRDTNVDQAVQNAAAPVEELAKGIMQLPGDKPRLLGQAILTNLQTVMQTPTMSQKATNEFEAKKASTITQAKSLGIPVPPEMDQSQGAGAPQVAGGLGQTAPAPAAPTPPPSAPGQQMAGGEVLPWLQSGASGGASAMPAAAPAPSAAATPAPSAPAPSAPAPTQGVTDQAAATPTTPSQPIIKANPQSEWRTKGEISTGSIPIEDIELVAAHPDAAAAFQQKYGADPSQILKDPPAPGEGNSFNDLLKTNLGLKAGPLETAMANQTAKNYQKQLDAVHDAQSMLQDNFQSRLLLKQGIYSGILSGPQLMWARMMVASGHASQDMIDKVDRTQSYMSHIASATANIIKKFGSGTGLSDADREFAKQAAGGDINMTPEALNHILEINSKSALWIISNPTKAAAHYNPNVDSTDSTGSNQ